MTQLDTCKGPECTNRGRRRSGLCDSHAQQMRRAGVLTPLKQTRTSADVVARDEQGRKHCPGCDQWKATPDFPADPNTSDGLRRVCGRCNTLSHHGLTHADYVALLARQNGACAGCGRVPDDAFQVDHDHGCCPGKTSCGRCVRGLLCGRCNRVLGFVSDDADVLRGLVAYLGRSL